MKELCYVCLYLSYGSALRTLSDKNAGILIKGLLHYAKTGEEPALPRACIPIWVFMKDQHDRDRERYEERCLTNRENGKKGGRPKNQTVS